MHKIIIYIIRAYQYVVSPYLTPSCRFSPTCSEYSIQAFQRFGFIRGLVLSVRRIFSCHPWHCAGHDPVPETFRFINDVKSDIKKDKKLISGNHK